MTQQNAAIQHLQQRGIEYLLMRRQREGHSQPAASDYGMDPASIAQGHLMQDTQGVVLVVTPRNRHPSLARLGQLLSRQLQAADELLVQQLFHCDDISAIAPLPLTTGLPVVVDTALRQQGQVCFEANDNSLLACVSIHAFMQLHHNSRWGAISDEGAAEVGDAPAQAASPVELGSLQQRLLALRELPPINDLTRQLLDIFKDPNVSVERLAEVIETDPSLAAQTLRHARSPYYGYAGQIDSVADAITKVLGFDTVLMTSLAISSGRPLQIPAEGRIGKQALCRHSLYSAVLARSLCRFIPKEIGITPGNAYLSALMQNIGFLLLGHLLRDDYLVLSRAVEANPESPLLQLEEKTLGINHAQIGTWLMRSWDMPNELITAIRHHHNVVYRGEYAGYVQLITLVNTLLWQHGIGDAPNDQPMEMLLKLLQIPADKAYQATERVLEQQDELNQLANSLSG